MQRHATCARAARKRAACCMRSPSVRHSRMASPYRDAPVLAKGLPGCPGTRERPTGMPVTITLRIGTAVTNSASARERAWRGRCRRRTIVFRACARAHTPLHRRASASIGRGRRPLRLYTDLAIYGCVIHGSGYLWMRYLWIWLFMDAIYIWIWLFMDALSTDLAIYGCVIHGSGYLWMRDLWIWLSMDAL